MKGFVLSSILAIAFCFLYFFFFLYLKRLPVDDNGDEWSLDIVVFMNVSIECCESKGLMC